MSDTLSKERRSYIMSRIRSRDTAPEKQVRSMLWQRGYRYRLNVKKLPGTPDIVLAKYRVVIFVHGCFWHRHENCKAASTPKRNITFWQTKFARNVQRDQRVQQQLRELRWRIHIIWECQLMEGVEKVLAELDALAGR
jgi:DNA mismatch endonuclease (patch repair protein)